MATRYVCYHNKYGYCKFKAECRKRHVDNICDEPSCDISACESRHPKNCKYYIQYGKCKFNPCAFLHVNTGNNINDLKKENEQILKDIENLDVKIKDLDAKMNEQNLLISKLQEFSEKMERFMVVQNNVNEKISGFGHFFERISKLEKTVGEKGEQIKNLQVKENSIDDLIE